MTKLKDVELVAKRQELKEKVIQAAITWHMTDSADLRFAANSGALAAAVTEYCKTTNQGWHSAIQKAFRA